MEDVGFSTAEIHEVLRIVAAILKLGNVNFVPTTNMDGTEGCALSNDYGEREREREVFFRPEMQPFFPTELYDVCELLQGDFSTLESSLISRTVEARNNEVLVADLSTSEAEASRDNLCRALYGRLFTWIVNKVNETIKVS